MKLELLILAIAPVITIVLWIYLKDKYDKEPIHILTKFFAFGILISVLAIYIEEWFIKINIFSESINIFYMSFIVAGLVEEGLKSLILIPNLLKEKNFNEKLDGIIFQGGDSFYKYEYECLKYAHEQNIPTLGICLGMQMMGCLFNGDLIKISNCNHKQKNKKYVHDIFIKKDSLLYLIFKTDRIKVNSRHKDTVINPDLEITAISTDGLIEALEDKSKKFFLGVQWHPESMTSYDILESRLFDYFVNICRK